MPAYSKFICQQCGYESPQWLGKCPGCDSWNSLVETRIEEQRSQHKISQQKTSLQKFSEIKTENFKRISTGFGELDRVLGQGIVPGSVVLLAGDPGIGKSTLLLQMALKLSGVSKSPSILYIAGEESPQQIKIRAVRFKSTPSDSLLLLPETNVENIEEVILEAKPDLVIVDSIQTLWSQNLTGAPGSVGQVRESATKLLKIAKEKHFPLFLIGHVTKEGVVAGPMVLNHIVDAVLYLEGERYQSLRLLRAVKNRFGPTDEIGVFRMDEGGLAEVTNPSELFLSKGKNEAGAVVTCALEGTRPILAEVQALVVPTQNPLPRRIFSGLDFNRCGLLLAVLQKKLGVPTHLRDVFLSVSGGLKIFEPAADLAIILAVFSSFKNTALPQSLVAFGEVSLLGELRMVGNLEKRKQEAKRLGFKTIISPSNFSNLNEVVQKLF